jgi:hypothetical protein
MEQQNEVFELHIVQEIHSETINGVRVQFKCKKSKMKAAQLFADVCLSDEDLRDIVMIASLLIIDKYDYPALEQYLKNNIK